MSRSGGDPRPFIARTCVICASARLEASAAVLMPFVADRVFGWKPVEITEDWGLQTVKSGMAYSICNSLQCQDCGHLFLDIRFSDDQLARLYRTYQDEDYARHRAQYEPGYIERNARLKETVAYLPAVEAFLAPHLGERPRILDWGGSRGDNTPFKDRRSAHDIYDISGEPPTKGARFVDLETALAGAYDLVVCSNVLEHVPYPVDTLSAVVQALSPETILYIEVPQEPIMRRLEDSPQAHRHKRHWHEHVNFYSRRSLERLIEQCGLEVIELGLLDVGATPDANYNYAVVCKRSLAR